MTAIQAHDFFEGYVQAFVHNDIDGICARWGYPALLAFDGRQLALDADAFRRNAVRLCAFYAAQAWRMPRKRSSSWCD